MFLYHPKQYPKCSASNKIGPRVYVRWEISLHRWNIFSNHIQNISVVSVFVLAFEVSAVLTGLNMKFRYGIMVGLAVEGVRLLLSLKTDQISWGGTFFPFHGVVFVSCSFLKQVTIRFIKRITRLNLWYIILSYNDNIWPFSIKNAKMGTVMYAVLYFYTLHRM